MQVRAKTHIWLRAEDRYIDVDEITEVDDEKGKDLIARGLAEQVTKTEAKQAAKATDTPAAAPASTTPAPAKA